MIIAQERPITILSCLRAKIDSMTTALIWFRRDLRLDDHAALAQALSQHARVVAVFIFDPTILDPLPRTDRRIPFILSCLQQIKMQLQAFGSELIVRQDNPRSAIPALARQFNAVAVYANRDYEPTAIARDREVEKALASLAVAWCDFKDQVVFEQDEILTRVGTPFGMFTPYWRNWRSKLTSADSAEYLINQHRNRLAQLPAEPLPSLLDLGFEPLAHGDNHALPDAANAQRLLQDFTTRIDDYLLLRDFPAKKGVSYLSPHLRFGTISIRRLVRLALQQSSDGAECWLKELCWRDFYQQLLWHRPDLVTHAFQPEFDQLPFPNDPNWFAAWCTGQTGYPLIDAGMRQLNQTGYMHNRLRMITASFLVKDLLIDWRWGENYFAEKLLDFDLASNNGGWQWAASVGCDAQPWFRIFNPVLQSKKFDPQGLFIRRYCPELSRLSNNTIHTPWLADSLTLSAAEISLGMDYPYPIIDHARQREAALALFKSASKSSHK